MPGTGEVYVAGVRESLDGWAFLWGAFLWGERSTGRRTPSCFLLQKPDVFTSFGVGSSNRALTREHTYLPG